MNDFVHTTTSYFAPLSVEILSSPLAQSLGGLPQGSGILRFVDYDGTLLIEDRRFDIDRNLAKKEYRGDNAYPYIQEKYSPTMDIDSTTGEVSYDKEGAYDIFIALLDPASHLFENISEFYDPNNPDHIILSAGGDKKFQEEKIDASGFGKNAKKIIVSKAGDKVLAMLKEVLRRGYIPKAIEFYDNKIGEEHFEGAAEKISKMLGGIRVDFFHMEKDINNPRRIQAKLHQVATDVRRLLEI